MRARGMCMRACGWVRRCAARVPPPACRSHAPLTCAHRGKNLQETFREQAITAAKKARVGGALLVALGRVLLQWVLCALARLFVHACVCRAGI